MPKTAMELLGLDHDPSWYLTGKDLELVARRARDEAIRECLEIVREHAEQRDSCALEDIEEDIEALLGKEEA